MEHTNSIESAKRKKLVHTCAYCGSQKVERVLLEEHEYLGLGIPVVIARSAIRTKCEDCENSSITVPNVEGLAAVVAITRVLDEARITPEEIVFLRKTIKLKARELAHILNVSPETLSRQEHGKIVLSPPLEFTLRMCVINSLRDHANNMDIDPLLIAKMATAGSHSRHIQAAETLFSQIRKNKIGYVWDREMHPISSRCN
jgi:DNA-binding transcriptional regulator YiaG